MMDFVFGWVRVKPGKRPEFMKLMPAHLAKQRAIPGVLWLEFNESFEDPDVITLSAGFENAQAHAAQVAGDADIVAKLEEIGVDGRFENISADTKRIDVLKFDGSARKQQLAHPPANAV
mgnify:CR=1 FL=1